jgi:tryptophan synthase beta chain
LVFGIHLWITINHQVEFIGVEAGGPNNSRLHAAPLTNKSKIGILHGAAQYVVQDKEGQISKTQSISAGLDYPGVSPLHCFLKDAKRARYTSAQMKKHWQLIN